MAKLHAGITIRGWGRRVCTLEPLLFLIIFFPGVPGLPAQEEFTPQLMDDDGHSDTVNAVAFSPDGHFLASGSDDETINIWDIVGKSKVHILHPVDGKVTSIAFSPDSLVLVSGGDRAVKLWDFVNFRESRSLAIGGSSDVHSVAFSPDGRVLAASTESSIKLWDAASGNELRTLNDERFVLEKLAFRLGNDVLASASNSARNGHRVILWDVKRGRELRLLEPNELLVTALAFSPDGSVLASGSNDGLKLWDGKSGRLLRMLPGHDKSYADPEEGGVANYIESVAFSRDGRLLAYGSTDRTIKLHEVSTLKQLRTLKGHTGGISCVAFSPDGRWLASAGYDNTVKIWEVATGKEIAASKPYFYNKNVGMRLWIPADWAKESEQEASFNQPSVVALRKSETLAHVVLVREVVEASADLYIRLFEQFSSRSFQKYHRSAEEKVTVDGIPGTKLTSTWIDGGIPYRAYIELFSAEKQHFRVVATAPLETFDRYRPVLEEMLNSLRFPDLHPSPQATPSVEVPTNRPR